MFAIDWTDSDFIFANSTCFQAPMMERLYQMSLKCKKGTWFMTLSKRLPHADKVYPENPRLATLHWEHIIAVKLEMSWGPATVNLQRKLTDPVVVDENDSDD